jgi:hypothetical protein
MGIGGIIFGIMVILLSKVFFQIVPDFPQVTYTPLFASIKLAVSSVPNLDILLGLIFILLQAALLMYFLNYHNVLAERSFFPFVIYIMLAGVYNEQYYLNPASFLNFFIILIIDRLLRLQDVGKNPGSIFLDIGALIGLSLLFSKEAVFYLPIILIGIIIIYTHNITNLLILLLTTFMVLFISAGIYYLIGDFEKYSTIFSFAPIELGINFSHWQERFYLLLFLFIIIFIFSYIHFQFGSKKITNKTKRFAGVFILLWALGVLVVIFQKVNLWFNMGLLVIPTTVFVSNYFQEEKGRDWLKNLLFIILILGIASIQLNY